jgi:pimeloyl-ACP methyl ester carboxylesterase
MRTWEVKDTGRDIPVTTHDADESNSDTPHIVIANGFVGGTLASALGRRLVDASKGTLAVSTYEEPHVGAGSYAESYRAEMFDKVMRSIGGRAVVLAHSRGMIAWRNAGPGLLGDKLVRGLAGLTPIGVSDLPYTSWPNIALRLSGEVTHPPLETLASAVMTAKVAGHILHRCRYPGAARKEVARTLQANTAESVISTSRAVPTVMIVGDRDRLVPPAEVYDRLSKSSGYEGEIVEIPASHAGAFADPRHTEAIVRALQQAALLEK